MNSKKLENHGESMIGTDMREIKACDNIIMVQKDNENKLISGFKMKNKRKLSC